MRKICQHKSARAKNMTFRNSTSAVHILNQRSNTEFARKLWLCDECGKVDSQSHIMWYPSYANNDLGVVHYFQSVVKIREALKNEN